MTCVLVSHNGTIALQHKPKLNIFSETACYQICTWIDGGFREKARYIHFLVSTKTTRYQKRLSYCYLMWITGNMYGWWVRLETIVVTCVQLSLVTQGQPSGQAFIILSFWFLLCLASYLDKRTKFLQKYINYNKNRRLRTVGPFSENPSRVISEPPLWYKNGFTVRIQVQRIKWDSVAKICVEIYNHKISLTGKYRNRWIWWATITAKLALCFWDNFVPSLLRDNN